LTGADSPDIVNTASIQAQPLGTPPQPESDLEAKGGILPNQYRRSFAFTMGAAGGTRMVHPEET